MFDFDDCKSVVMRIVKAYKLTTIKSLCDMWGIAASVIASRIQRNSLPADLVLRCYIDTKADPVWLLTGQGESSIDKVQVVKKGVILSDEILEKLERLSALKEKGSITEDEFNMLKSNLIG